MVRGDYLEILNTDRKWWKVRAANQEVGITSRFYKLNSCYRSDMFPTQSCGC